MYIPPAKGSPVRKDRPKKAGEPAAWPVFTREEMEDEVAAAEERIMKLVSARLDEYETAAESVEAIAGFAAKEIARIGEQSLMALLSVNVEPGRPGKDADTEEIARRVAEIIGSPKPGENGNDADMDAVLAKVREMMPSEDQIVERLMSKVKTKGRKSVLKVIQQNVEADPTSVIEKILEMLESGKVKLKTSHVDGLDQTFSSMYSQIGRKGYLHGGGDTVVAGIGIDIQPTADGKKRISTTGTSVPGYSYNEVPAGDMDGVNTIFTLANVPTAPAVMLVDLNGAIQTQLGTSPDYSIAGDTITFNFAPSSGGVLTVYYS